MIFGTYVLYVIDSFALLIPSVNEEVFCATLFSIVQSDNVVLFVQVSNPLFWTKLIWENRLKVNNVNIISSFVFIE
ncbi:hypothetical protein D3C85_348520 [compost metagenome]